jgi:hypothetical protein
MRIECGVQLIRYLAYFSFFETYVEAYGPSVLLYTMLDSSKRNYSLSFIIGRSEWQF